jgi:hypothetical protein
MATRDHRLSQFTTDHDPPSDTHGLYKPNRSAGVITPALRWAHARRRFCELAEIASNARRGKGATPSHRIGGGQTQQSAGTVMVPDALAHGGSDAALRQVYAISSVRDD